MLVMLCGYRWIQSVISERSCGSIRKCQSCMFIISTYWSPHLSKTRDIIRFGVSGHSFYHSLATSQAMPRTWNLFSRPIVSQLPNIPQCFCNSVLSISQVILFPKGVSSLFHPLPKLLLFVYGDFGLVWRPLWRLLPLPPWLSSI